MNDHRQLISVPYTMSTRRKVSLYIMSALYMLAGIMHFLRPSFYMAIMPPYLPAHYELVLLSGVCEFVLGLLLLFPVSRRMAAWGIILLLIAVFPANIQMAIDYYQQHKPGLWITILRLPLQIPLVYWAYQFTRKRTTHR